GAARDERHAVPRLDGAASRLLESELEACAELAEAATLSPQLVLDHLTHSRTSLHEDEWPLAELVQPDRPPREGMVWWAGENHLVGEERLECDRTVAAGGADDAELELPVRNL